jgi:hypothetical protein
MVQRLSLILAALLFAPLPSAFAQTVAAPPTALDLVVAAKKEADAKEKTEKTKRAIGDILGALPTIQYRSAIKKDKINSTLSPGEEVIESISKGNKAINGLSSGSESCAQAWSRAMEIKNKFSTATVSEPNIPPTKNENSLNNPDVICGSRPGDYDICIPKSSSAPSGFKFLNTSRDRDWNFYFQDSARQDLGFSITDGMSTSGSRAKETYMMVFPRKSLPSIKIEGNHQIVTLPNGETITYDVTTKKILGGVLDDNKVYTGNGIVLRVDRTGNDARFSNSANPTAIITKQGKTCKVSKKSLWPDQSNSSALHFKYASDESFDAFLKQKCGFGLD